MFLYANQLKHEGKCQANLPQLRGKQQKETCLLLFFLRCSCFSVSLTTTQQLKFKDNRRSAYVLQAYFVCSVVRRLKNTQIKWKSYLRGVPSSWGWIITTLTLTDVRSRSIICSWVRVATATLQISTSRLPCLSPAFQAKPKGSTSATMPSKLTWKPSWPRLFRRKVISDVSHPRVVIWNQNEFGHYLQ